MKRKNYLKFILSFIIYFLCVSSISCQTQNSILTQLNNTDIMRICVYCTIIILIFLIIVSIITKLLSLLFRNIDSIKFGKFDLKLRKLKKDNSQTKEIDFSQLLKNFELITRMELKYVVSEIISATNDIHIIETEYDKSVKTVFEKNFSILERDLHDKFVQLACEETKFDLINIKNTREYFFILDLLSEYQIIWMSNAKDITRRNGFVDFLNDKSKAETYINELIESINQCIDMGKLESTVLPKSRIDEIIKESYKKYYMSLEKMFLSLASMKEKMLQKRKDKFEYIDNSVISISEKIIHEVKENVLKTFTDEETKNEESNSKEEEK